MCVLSTATMLRRRSITNTYHECHTYICNDWTTTANKRRRRVTGTIHTHTHLTPPYPTITCITKPQTQLPCCSSCPIHQRQPATHHEPGRKRQEKVVLRQLHRSLTPRWKAKQNKKVCENHRISIDLRLRLKTEAISKTKKMILPSSPSLCARVPK